MRGAIFTLLAYAIGGFPTGVVLSRQKYGLDVREMGSGNIGATNITRTFGWYAGALTFLVDCAKGYLPLFYFQRFAAEQASWMPWVGVALVAGHCFSPYLKFRGGKGVATSLGVLLAVVPTAGGIAAVTYGVFLAATRISAIGSLAALAAVNGFWVVTRPGIDVVRLILGISFLVVVRHHTNLRRLWHDYKKKKGRS